MKKKSIALSVVLAATLGASPEAAAQTFSVRMTTEAAVGSPLKFLVNRTYHGVTVDWGDGTPVTYNTADENGICVVEGTAKGRVVSISGNGAWTMLSCEGCSLSDLDLSQATQLRSLYCQHNRLTTLSVKNMTQLTDLNCSYNSLKKLGFSMSVNPALDLPVMENLDVSHNEMEGMYYLKLPRLQYLDASHNQYTSIYLYEPNVRGVDCSFNQIKGGINLSRCSQLEYVLCSDNQVESISLPAEAQQLRQVVCDNNHITSLQLETAENLTDLSCSDNGMSDVAIHRRAALSSLNLGGNMLGFNSLPPKSNAPQYLAFEPQAPFDISKVEGVKMRDGVPYAELAANWNDRNKTGLNMKEYCSLSNGRFDAAYQWLTVGANGEEHELKLRSSSAAEGDFSASSGVFAFFTPQQKAYVRLTSKTYGFSVTSTPLAIGEDLTAIEQTTTAADLTISVANGQIVLRTSSPLKVVIFSANGQRVWQNVVEGLATVGLPHGVYIVNEKKILL